MAGRGVRLAVVCCFCLSLALAPSGAMVAPPPPPPATPPPVATVPAKPGPGWTPQVTLAKPLRYRPLGTVTPVPVDGHVPAP
jgi:hypothetical protein